MVADDAHWLDRSSLDALAFISSRLDGERVVLLAGARGQAPPSGFDRGFPELHREPLSAADAGRLLDLQPRLYRSYPKLGVASRHQLRDVIALTSTPTTAHESTGSETHL